jgi:hypothetical protein
MLEDVIAKILHVDQVLQVELDLIVGCGLVSFRQVLAHHHLLILKNNLVAVTILVDEPVVGLPEIIALAEVDDVLHVSLGDELLKILNRV